MPRQFIRIAYRENDDRTYTFHNDGDPVEPGDVVHLRDGRDPTRTVRGYVRGITEEPPFPTKGIICKLEDDE